LWASKGLKIPQIRHASSTLRPPKDSPHLSLSEPLSLTSLHTIHRLLTATSPPLVNASNSNDGSPAASVLMGLCNMDGVSGIILEVRNSLLRAHSGEISFPGGKADKTDATLIDTALRETQEEIGVRPSQVEILGQLSPAVPSLSGLPVHCFVGYIHSLDLPQPAATSPAPIEHAASDRNIPLRSIALSSLTASASEVSQIFHLPLSYLIDPRRLRIHKLPRRPPYYALNVTDRVNVGKDVVPLHVPGSFEGGGDEREELGDHPDAPRIEVWGLTGWYLNQFMRRLNVY